MDSEDRRARLPQVERILCLPEVSAYFPRLSRPFTVRAVSRVLAAARTRLAEDDGWAPVETELIAAVIAELEDLDRKRFRKVLNGTGIVLHTNLGRAPVSTSAWSEAGELNTGYSNLEFDLCTGNRGRRGGLTSELLCLLTGAGGALVTNNNAAALLLILAGVGFGREVLVSRGEAVQIGGGFRIPDIIEASGVRLKEVGTTNVTTEEDYLRAIGPETAAVLIVHASNFALRGFVRKPNLRSLAAALPQGIPLIVDQGSGCTTEAVPGEIPAMRYLRDGAKLVCFSCDKVLGGPQAGVVAGDAALVAKLARYPLMRAFRPGKSTLALLERSLVARLGTGGAEKEGTAGQELSSVERALKRSGEEGLAELRAYGRRIQRKLPRGSARVVESRAAFGGGSSPDETIPSIALALRAPRGALSLIDALRSGRVPLICRAEEDTVLADLIGLADEDPSLVAEMIAAGLKREGIE